MSATSRRVLIVDDDETYRTALVRAFARRGFTVFSAGSVASALALIESEPLDHASIDLRMPGGSGLELVRRLKALQPATVIVVLTGYGSIATAVEAVKLGAADYFDQAGGRGGPVASVRSYRAGRSPIQRSPIQGGAKEKQRRTIARCYAVCARSSCSMSRRIERQDERLEIVHMLLQRIVAAVGMR